MKNFLRHLVEHWPFTRGQTRLIMLLRSWLLREAETISPIGRVLFPFQPYQWNFFFGVHEKETKYLVRTFLDPGDTFLDIGANVGYFSAIAADATVPGGTVIALEPEPMHYARLKRLKDLNPHFDIQILQSAMSDRCGQMSFYVCDHPGWHSLIADFPRAEIKQTIKVDTWTLDELLIQRRLNCPGAVKFAKVDVEGAEHLVLRGAKETLRHHWVQAFDVEVSPSANAAEIFSHFAAAGYQAFHWISGIEKWRSYPADLALQGQENILWISTNYSELLAKVPCEN